LREPFSSPAGRPHGEHSEPGPRIAIFGAGAIGCWVGGRLAAGGARVTLIGRPRVLDELSNGLTVSDLDGDRYTVRVPTTSDHGAVRDADIVLVTVKSAQTAGAGVALAKVLPKETTVVSLQNGVRNVDVLREKGITARAGMVPWNVVRRLPGAYHRGSSGVLMIEHHARDGAWYGALAAAGIAFQTRNDMVAVQWAKLVLNLNNAVNALSGLPLREELSLRGYRKVLAAAQREAIELLAQKGQYIARLTPLPARFVPRVLDLPDSVFRIVARPMIAIDPHARSSMWDDLEARRATEIEYLQGEIVTLAEALGVPAKAAVNRALVKLVRAAETGGRRSFTADDLCAATGVPATATPPAAT